MYIHKFRYFWVFDGFSSRMVGVFFVFFEGGLKTDKPSWTLQARYLDIDANRRIAGA